MQFVKPMPFEEAAQRLGSRTPIGSALTSEQWARVPVELRERAMFSATVENTRFLQRSRDFITDFLKGAREELPFGGVALKAGSRAQFVKELSQFAVAQGMGPLDPKDAGSIKDIRSQTRLSLIFNTVTQQAQGYGYWKQGQDPDVLDAFPAQRFIRVADVKEARGEHATHEGTVLLKNDPFWAAINEDFRVPWPPFGFGCQHDVEDVSRDEAEQLGLLTPRQRVAPVEKEFNENLKASTAGLDPEMLDYLRASFGEQVEFDEQQRTIRWRKKAGGPA